MSDLIASLELEIVERLKIALTAPGQPHPRVEVAAWPDRPRDYKMTHPVGAVMVIYKGCKFDSSAAIAGQAVQMEAEVELGSMTRSLREPQAPDRPDAPGTGAYDILNITRQSLLGWQPTCASDVVILRSESFDSYVEGTWGYSQRFVVPLFVIADRPEPPSQAVMPSGLSQITFTPSS
jgi:hypothetical protein